jgi:glycosyltransferase involved in cell wall biosynthesis
MTKRLVIQIPAYNEAEILGQTLSDLPKEISGIDEIKILVINDGSTDNTEKIAFEYGADYVLRHRMNRGLALTFMDGLQVSLALGADIIVNTDADNQYPGRYIVDLVAPIFRNEADMTIGNRQPGSNQHFSKIKQWLEEFGSYVIRKLSQTDAPDAASGFRAFSRYSALRMIVYNRFSYTLETLILAGWDRMKIIHLPIQTNPGYRPSRLHQGILNFIWKQTGVIIRSFMLYQPLKIFGILSLPFIITGLGLIFRFVYFYLIGESGIGRYSQSISIGGTLFIFGFVLFLLGLLGDAIRANRKTTEDLFIYQKNNARIGEFDTEFLGSPLIRKDMSYGEKSGK